MAPVFSMSITFSLGLQGPPLTLGVSCISNRCDNLAGMCRGLSKACEVVDAMVGPVECGTNEAVHPCGNADVVPVCFLFELRDLCQENSRLGYEKPPRLHPDFAVTECGLEFLKSFVDMGQLRGD